MKGSVRQPVIAGTWYPGNPHQLQVTIEEYLKAVKPDPEIRDVIGLVSPHAGYFYSGQVAAYGYRYVQDSTFDAVIIIAPSHHVLFSGASIYREGAYKTPLGIVPIHDILAEEILKQGKGVIDYIPHVHQQEHSIEIQLPFLQVVLGDFAFVPVIMGMQDLKTCEEVASAVFNAARGRKVLIVASTDLSHYHDYETAVALDGVALKYMRAIDASGFLKVVGRGEGEACGAGPVAVAMMVARKAHCKHAKILKYANSGDVTKEKQGVVGYTSVAFYNALKD